MACSGIDVTPRQVFAWKFWFYDVALPLARRIGPRFTDAALGLLGRLAAPFRLGLKKCAAKSLARVNGELSANWDVHQTASALVANVPRYLARDYPLDDAGDQTLARFTVEGETHLIDALAEGRGVVLVGSHLGAHVAGIHWLFRREIPIRLLVQRPKHLSKTLERFFQSATPHPQAKLFLRRGLTTGEAADRILRAHAALRAGMAVYFNGDIPWLGPNARPGTLAGVARPFLAVWADLAVLTHAPVIFVTCTHEAGGRYRLNFTSPITIASGDEQSAVDAYLRHLDDAIRTHPTEAVPHLTWPSFTSDDFVMPCERKHHLRPLLEPHAPRSPGGLAPQPSLFRKVR